MNRTLALLLWGIAHIALVFPAATAAEVLADVDRLVSEKKYLSAFELLNKQENGNSNPDIVLKKAELALKYFVNSINHRIFSFRDLKEDEDILKVRGAPGSSIMFPFDFQEVFTALIKNNPEEALKYFLLCDKIAPIKFENMKRLMGLYVQLGRGEEAKAVGERIFEMDPVNPAAARVFLDSYAGPSIQGELPGIFNGLAAKYAGNPEAVGNVLFHLSVFYMQSGESDMALKIIDKAEGNFRMSLKEDHAVFKAIEQIRQTAGKRPAPK